MFLHKLKTMFKKESNKYPDLGSKMKTAEEVAAEMIVARDKQLEAGRQNRPDLAAIHKTRFEALVWVLGKDYASATVR